MSSVTRDLTLAAFGKVFGTWETFSYAGFFGDDEAGGNHGPVPLPTALAALLSFVLQQLPMTYTFSKQYANIFLLSF